MDVDSSPDIGSWSAEPSYTFSSPQNLTPTGHTEKLRGHHGDIAAGHTGILTWERPLCFLTLAARM